MYLSMKYYILRFQLFCNSFFPYRIVVVFRRPVYFKIIFLLYPLCRIIVVQYDRLEIVYFMFSTYTYLSSLKFFCSITITRFTIQNSHHQRRIYYLLLIELTTYLVQALSHLINKLSCIPLYNT